MTLKTVEENCGRIMINNPLNERQYLESPQQSMPLMSAVAGIWDIFEPGINES